LGFRRRNCGEPCHPNFTSTLSGRPDTPRAPNQNSTLTAN
jgi:hypothetical protein